MPRSVMIRPDLERTAGQIEFAPIPLNRYCRPLLEELDHFSPEALVRIYRDMAIIRGFETMLNEVKLQGKFHGVEYNHRGPAHLSIGQEAAAVGQAFLLADRVRRRARSHRCALRGSCAKLGCSAN